MQTVVKEWVKRILGYGALGASGWVGHRFGPEAAEWVSAGVAVVGGIILNKALPFVFPTTRKVVESKPPLR